MDNKHIVGIADMKIAKGDGTLITYALGSCIGICLYDPAIKLGGMIHIMLPESLTLNNQNIFKYADTGIKETLRKMESLGANRHRMTGKIAGGAKMFEAQITGPLGNIGERNAMSTRAILRAEGIKLIKEDIGANYARTLSFDVETGIAKIKSFGKPDIIF